MKSRVLSLLSNLERIRRDGTPDMEFAVVGLLIRVQVASGRPEDARQNLLSLRKRFADNGENRFLPNMDAMLCRIDMYLGDEVSVDRWYREKAPRDMLNVRVMKRYQYMTQAMAELALGDEATALLTLAPLESYFNTCARYIDSIHLHVLGAIARYRLQEGDWQKELIQALEISAEFQFIRPVSQYGGAVLPLLLNCDWKGKESFLKRVIAETRRQAVWYPDFLQPRLELKTALSPTEMQVLRLICSDKSNAEIGQILGIKVHTVKVHVSHILEKLGVKRRAEAKSMALRLRLI